MKKNILINLISQNIDITKKANYKIALKQKNTYLSIKPYIESDIKVSVITCTNRPRYMKNVLENYHRQLYRDKELIIILNDNKMKINEWTTITNNYPDITVFQVDEKKSLGYCLNYAIEKAQYNVIAKLDDDDYYGPEYLSQAVNALKYADVVGKYCTYVYFEESKTLAIRNPKRENQYVYRLEGPTLVFRKEIFNTVKFKDKSLGEDIQFCKDCLKNGIKLYATDKYNYVYVRHGSKDKHAWNIRDELYKKLCLVIGEVEDYASFIESSKTKSNKK